jgi:hypothetical protein
MAATSTIAARIVPINLGLSSQLRSKHNSIPETSDEVMLKVEEWAEIRRLHKIEGFSQQAPGRKLGLNRGTVAKADGVMGFLNANGKRSRRQERAAQRMPCQR